jgi:gamma-glutamyltranspeptidase/glutathione hydrolase
MALRTRWIIDKEEVVAKNGAVAATRPAQADAGLEMLKDGGSAVDAAVAVGFLVSVMEPMETCTGGCGFMLVWDPKSGKTHSIEFGPRAPAAARPDMYEIAGDTDAESLTVYMVKDDANATGYLAPGIPATVAGLVEAHRRFGRLPLSRVLEPAIAWAEEGFEADYYYTHTAAGYVRALNQFPRAAETFLVDGLPPAEELPKRMPQRALAETLRQIGRDGGESFYRGEIADAMLREIRDGGGILSREDLANYHPDVVDPMSQRYRDVDVQGPAAPGGHWTELQILGILNQFDLRASGHNTPETLHTMIEASRLAFMDRYYHFGDPDLEPVPLEGLFSSEYARELAATVDPQRAQYYTDGPQEPWGRYAFEPKHDPWKHHPAGKAPKRFIESPPVATGGTTHFCAVDSDRMLVSCTHTAAHAFGAKFLTEPGVHIHAGMNWFTAMPGAANSIAGGKRPLCNMGPLLATQNGKPYMALGAPGGRRIMECLVQILSNVVDHGMSMQVACSAPRMDSSSRLTYYDDRLDGAVIERLAAMGHHLSPVFEDPVGYEFAHPTSILVGDDGYVRCGVDPFRKMWAAGY